MSLDELFFSLFSFFLFSLLNQIEENFIFYLVFPPFFCTFLIFTPTERDLIHTQYYYYYYTNNNKINNKNYYYIYHQLTSTVFAFLNFGVNMFSQCFCWSFPTCSYSSIHHHNLNHSTNKKQQQPPFLLFLRLRQPKPKSSPFKLTCLGAGAGAGAGTGTELFDQISQLAHNKVQNCCYPIYSFPFNLLSHYLNSYSFTGFSCSWYFCCNWTAL